MKIASCFAVAAAAALLAVADFAVAEDSLVNRLERGQKTFESACSSCHEIDKPLSKDMDRIQWEATLIQMTGRGAEISSEDKALIIDYLTARFTFSGKCTVCHTREQVYDREKTLAEWEKTVAGMAKKQPGLISEAEARVIIAYLTLVLGRAPSFSGE
jgi:competence protein ComEA